MKYDVRRRSSASSSVTDEHLVERGGREHAIAPDLELRDLGRLDARLSEPTNGLDREGIALLVDLLAERAAEGRAAILATHERAFLERVATAKIALVGGRAIAE